MIVEFFLLLNIVYATQNVFTFKNRSEEAKTNTTQVWNKTPLLFWSNKIVQEQRHSSKDFLQNGTKNFDEMIAKRKNYLY